MRSALFAVKLNFPLAESLYEKLMEMVSDERRQRAKRFFRREDACRSLAGEALARHAVGLREHALAPGFQFTVNEHGKPFARLPYGTHFNVSHSGTWVVCAVGDRPVGVDVERIHAVDLDISKRFFSVKEHAALSALPDEKKTERFFEYWTLKESYIKAIGKGLSCPLGSFTISFATDGCIAMEAGKNMPHMFFRQYDIDPAYKCALCVSHGEMPEGIIYISLEELAFSRQ